VTNAFGFADVTQRPVKMLAYGYTEDEGRKRGNNVASLVMKVFHYLVQIKANHIQKLVVHHVLTLLLVDWNHIHVVCNIFYIHDGNAMSACNWLFNQLKK
jgi:hypothetical protein